MSEIHLLLVEDHEVVRTGLRMLLEGQPDIIICCEASNGQEALDIAEKCHPDVVIMDITLPDMSGIEVTRRLKEKYPEMAVVALTIHDDEEYFFQMLQAGASGYVPKRAAPDDLITAIRTAKRDEIYIYPALAKSLVTDYLRHATNDAETTIPDVVTPREQEVLELLAQGHSNEEIAEMLSISKHTVARHRENLMRKLELHSRSDLVKYAIRKGIIKA
jgi:DNA-binding NarL/FixJ family response regulator